MTEENQKWHLDKNVPVALIFVIVAQTSAFVWWAADINARVSGLEKRDTLTYPYGERISRLETQTQNIAAGINEIKQLLRAKQ